MPILDLGQDATRRYYTAAWIEPPAVGTSVTGTFHITTASGAASIYIGLQPIVARFVVDEVTDTVVAVSTA